MFNIYLKPQDDQLGTYLGRYFVLHDLGDILD